MPTSYASAVIEADASQVWSLVRDFDGLDQWMAAVESSEIEDAMSADRVGCVRHLRLTDGGEIRERLVDLDDAQRRCSYDILDSPFPVRRYRATIRVAAITDRITGAAADTPRSFVEWWADYDCAAGDEAELDKTFARGVFGGGLAGLRQHFGEGSAGPTRHGRT